VVKKRSSRPQSKNKKSSERSIAEFTKRPLPNSK
jgi:hypothetical protein